MPQGTMQYIVGRIKGQDSVKMDFFGKAHVLWTLLFRQPTVIIKVPDICGLFEHYSSVADNNSAGTSRLEARLPAPIYITVSGCL